MLGDVVIKLKQFFCIHHYEYQRTLYIPPFVRIDSGDNCCEIYKCTKCGRVKSVMKFDPNHLGI